MSADPSDYVFVSYSREDRERLDEILLDALEYRGIPYWYDKHIDWDASWWRDDVRPHLQSAHAVIVVMTEPSEDSQWVLREITVATETGIAIFPILVDGTGIDDLDDRQHLDLSAGGKIPADWLDQVAERVRRGRTARLAKKTGRHAITAVGLIAGLIAIFGLMIPLITREQDALPTFAADYGIGVTEFPLRGEAPAREDAAVVVRGFQPRLVAGVAARLATEDAATNPDVTTPNIEVLLLPRELVATGTQRDTDARALLIESGGDILVYGGIEADGATLVARPSVYLTTLPRAEELSGPFDLTPISQDVTEQAGALLLRSRIADLGGELATIARLIEFYDGDRIDEGVAYIDALDGPTSISGILAIFEGNMRGKAGQFDAAEAAYRRALDDPEVHHRARLGLAQVRFTVTLGPDGWCTDDTDVDAMLAVIDEYDDLKSAQTRPGANIETKAQLGSGRAQLCLESAGLVPTSTQGRDDLENVIAVFEAEGMNDGDVRELAAEAEGLIGFVDSTSAGSAEVRERARDHLERAVQLTVFSERKIAFRIALADADQRDGNTSAACRQVDEIEQLLAGDRSVSELRVRYGCATATEDEPSTD